MNQTIINRIIGSIVLGLVAVAILPKLLTPAPSEFTVDGFELVVNNHSTADMPSRNPDVSIDSTPPLELQSVTENSALLTAETTASEQSTITQPTAEITQPQEQVQPMPVKLESLSQLAESTASKPLQTNDQTTNNGGNAADKTSWIRVGSYADLENADKLAEQFKARKLPVKVEAVQISGVAYKRVLVGPFTDNNKLQNVIKIIQAEGHAPAVQYE